MGLNQEVEPSVREQSARLATLPPARRLSGFSRRTFLAGGLAVASSILGLRHSSAETLAETPVNPEQLLSDAVTKQDPTLPQSLSQSMVLNRSDYTLI